MLDPLSLNIPLAVPVSDAPVLPTRKLLSPSDTYPDDYILELDNSSLEKFTTCPRAAENYLVRSREGARDSSATSFGKLFHECEELRLRHGLSDAVVTKQQELVFQHFLHHPVSPDDHRTGDRMLRILKLYNDRYASDGWPEKVLKDSEGKPFVERPFKVPVCTLKLDTTLPYAAEELLVDFEGRGTTLPSGLYISSLHVFWTGRIDAALLDSNSLWAVDHKTSSIGGAQYYEDFRLSNQTVGYCWALEQLLRRPVAGLMLNALVIRKETKTGTSTEFNRVPFFYTPDRLAEWEENIKHLVSDFVANLCRGYFPMHTKWCMGKYGVCPYHENCCLPRSQRASDLSSDLYRDVTWSPMN